MAVSDEVAVKATVDLGGRTIGRLIGWGKSNSIEAVEQTIARTNSLTAGDVIEMQRGGITKAWVLKQYRAYCSSILKEGMKLNNNQLLPRKALFEKIIKLWK
jgi:hypothetical protein